MGVPNIFDRTGYRHFYGALVANPALTDFVHVSRLEVGDAAVAASLGLLLGDCYYLILSSYQDGPLARFGVGRAHLHELLRYAIARDFRRFDFTVGDEPYKRDWCDIEVRLHDYLAAATPAGFVAVAALNAFRATKRTIKQNEVLWRLYSRARARKGALFADRAGGADAAEGGGTHQDD
jgi:CelD/BcsL family acetyltransferase involved in cellulose biosynthesis